MAAPLITRQRLVALKTESTAGTAESLAGADAAINCYDTTYTPEINMGDRPSQGTYDAPLPSVPGARMGRIGFRTDFFGGDNAALWFARILPHAGFTVSSLTATAVGSASTAAATIAAYVDGGYYQLAGAVVTSLSIAFERGEPIYSTVEYQGKYADPTDVALLTPTYPTDPPERFASGNFTLGGTELPTFSGTIDIANTVEMRPDPTDATGYLHAQITQQTITANLVAEAALAGTRNDFTAWTGSTTQTLALTTADSCVVTLPGMQRTNVQTGDSNGILNRTLEMLHTGTSAATIVSG